MEEKKKKNQAKKKTTTKKKTTSKKVDANKPATKKTAPKTTPAKKTAPKKIEQKVEPKKEEKPIEKKEDINLEKTIIFDSKQKRNLKEVVDKLEEETVVVDDKVIKRSKIRKILIIIIAIAMVVVAAASIAYVVSQRKAESHYNETTGSNLFEKTKEKKIESVETRDEEIQTEEKYEHIVTINLAKFEAKAANKDDMVVLVASSSCSACVQFEPDVEKTFADLDKKIYRIDIKSMTDEEINTFREYYAFSVTPTIFVVKKGIVVSDTARTGRMKIDELKEWLDKNI